MKLLKTLMLLIIVIFLSSCYTDTTNGTFEVMDVNRDGNNIRYQIDMSLDTGDVVTGKYNIKYTSDKFSIGDKLVLKVVNESEDPDIYILKVEINNSIYYTGLKYRYLLRDNYITLHAIDDFYYATNKKFKLNTYFKFYKQGHIEPKSSIRRDGINMN